MVKLESSWTRRAAFALAVIAAISVLWFGLRTFGSLILLQSAYQVGMPQGSSVRAWMTLHYVARTYRVPEERLIASLGLPSDTSPDISLKSLAEREHVLPLRYVQRVQQSLAGSADSEPSSNRSGSSGWLDWLRDDILSALLKYGYPALMLTLFLGAFGLPVPTGLAAAVAGSLSASGRMDWITAVIMGIVASALGDLIAYGVGRSVGAGFLERRGHWIGFTPERYARAQLFFNRWGGAVVLITRTLVSSFSSIVSVVAGVNRYRLSAFLTFVVLGRVVWTSAYVGLGYAVGSSLDAATGFLANLTGLILSSFVVAAAALVGSGRADHLLSQPITTRKAN